LDSHFESICGGSWLRPNVTRLFDPLNSRPDCRSVRSHYRLCQQPPWRHRSRLGKGMYSQPSDRHGAVAHPDLQLATSPVVRPARERMQSKCAPRFPSDGQVNLQYRPSIEPILRADSRSVRVYVMLQFYRSEHCLLPLQISALRNADRQVINQFCSGHSSPVALSKIFEVHQHHL
jgi:hypothetical protein